MSRQLGSRYVLDDVIGKGASGQVWRAHDVDGAMFAVKVLRASIADDSESVARFVQERTILMSLGHPNLVRVQDMVVEGDTLALVMELVSGGDLRVHLKPRGTLPVEEACGLTASIADGLAAMHAAGIIHRDIKPENVLIDMSSGSPVPKITDFSIAKIVSTAKQSTMMAGTPSYVAPELFDDRPPTVQSDLYSLGIVLYELLAGVPPFRSDSLLSMMKMHATEPPPRPPGIPDHVWSAIERMLAKDPVHRGRDASEAARSLRALTSGDAAARTLPRSDRTLPRPSAVTVVRANVSPQASEATQVRAAVAPEVPLPPAPVVKRRSPAFVAALIGTACVLTAAVALGVWFVVKPDEKRIAQTSAAGHEPVVPCSIAFARDGYLYATNVDGSRQMQLVTGANNESEPAWSPDGKQIAFVATRPSADGTQGDIWIMNADGSDRRALTDGADDDRNPKWSPDGRNIAFTRWFENTEGNDDGDVYVAEADGSGARAVVEGASEDGRPTWSPDGKKIAFVRWIKLADGDDDGDILVADTDGSNIEPLTTGDTNDNYPAWSPDGSRIAFMRPASRDDDAQTDIYVAEVDGSGEKALTHTESSERNPAWSPHGRRIAFAQMSGSGDAEQGDIYVLDVDDGSLVAVTNTDQSDMFPAWSPGCRS